MASRGCSVVSSRVSPLFRFPQLCHICSQSQSGQSHADYVMQPRTDGVHRRESASTDPAVLKVALVRMLPVQVTRMQAREKHVSEATKLYGKWRLQGFSEGLGAFRFFFKDGMRAIHCGKRLQWYMYLRLD